MRMGVSCVDASYEPLSLSEGLPKKLPTNGSWTEKEVLSQGFDEGWTDEHKSLPHFPFLLLKAKLTFWNLWILPGRLNSLNLSHQ